LRQTSNQAWETEYRFRKADNTYTLLRNRAFVIQDTSHKPERLIGTCLDITESKRLDRAKDEFISLVSHQLRTPLTVIQLYGNMLRSGLAEPLKPEQQTYVDKMTNASVRLIKLVGDILNISRLELNRIRISTKPIDANELIQTCIDELTPSASAKGAAIEFTPSEHLGLVPLDTTVFGEIVHNLISNGIRYGRDKGGKVSVDFQKEGRTYVLAVADNGIGIPAADQTHIYERFYRADNASRVDGEGTGLGLYLVKMFAETAGGNTWFTSRVGKGTTFYVSFPAVYKTKK
jgi:signal transduction histidine kinase